MIRSSIYTVLTLLVGLASVVGSELTLINWMQAAPFDITGNFFWLGLLPTQLVVVGVGFLLLAVVFRRHRLLIPLYMVVFCAAHALELNSLQNPPFDIFLYIVAILIAGAAWLALWWPLFLRPRP